MHGFMIDLDDNVLTVYMTCRLLRKGGPSLVVLLVGDYLID